MENPSAFKISSIGPHILGKQIGPEDHTISTFNVKYNPNFGNFECGWIFHTREQKSNPPRRSMTKLNINGCSRMQAGTDLLILLKVSFSQ